MRAYVDVPAVKMVLPANGRFMETAGIEPAPRFPRDLDGDPRDNVSASKYYPVPLRNGAREVIAYAVLEIADAHLALHRWYLDSDSRPGGKMYARRNQRTAEGKLQAVYLHREVLGLTRSDPGIVDHINGLTLDNRRANLRVLSRAENAQNQGVRKSNKSSAYRGVTWDKARRKWMARGTLNGVPTTIGRFDTELEAAEAAREWRRQHMPFSNREDPAQGSCREVAR